MRAYDRSTFSTIGTVSVIDGNTLEGVSTTTLWTLYNRASEAKRPDGIIDDPMAIALYEAIDYDYRKFGRPNQSHALRAAAFDAVAVDYLAGHPRAALVALAEGLQTSFWRLDDRGLAGEHSWYSVDLPPVMALREQLLPEHRRIVNIAQSALDRSWMDRVDASDGVFITAEGLLMYLDPADVRSLIADCAKRFPGGQMMFDTIPPMFSRMTMKGGVRLSSRYRTPPMPFGITPSDAIGLAGQIPGVRSARTVPHVPGRGIFKVLAAPALNRVPVVRSMLTSMTLLEFA